MFRRRDESIDTGDGGPHLRAELIVTLREIRIARSVSGATCHVRDQPFDPACHPFQAIDCKL